MSSLIMFFHVSVATLLLTNTKLAHMDSGQIDQYDIN